MAVSVHIESGRQWDLHWKLVFLTDRCCHGLINPEARMVGKREEQRLCCACILLMRHASC